MHFESLEDLTRRVRRLGDGPVLMLLCEDATEVESSLRHHLSAGFAHVVLAAPPGVALPRPADERTHVVPLATRPDDLAATCVNALIAGRPDGAWTGYAYNAEYLFHPFAETRRVGEALAFAAEERRDAILCFVVDLYGARLDAGAVGIDPAEAWLDETGYFALARHDPATGHPRERQLDFHGGLRWRYEEHVPVDRRRIDRVALFRSRPGLRLRPDHTLSVEEMNTYQCPWHHSLTACIASFRAAKALATNPGSRAEISRFQWDGSVRFEWRAQQLMDLGLMEPGQWF